MVNAFRIAARIAADPPGEPGDQRIGCDAMIKILMDARDQRIKMLTMARNKLATAMDYDVFVRETNDEINEINELIELVMQERGNLKNISIRMPELNQRTATTADTLLDYRFLSVLTEFMDRHGNISTKMTVENTQDKKAQSDIATMGTTVQKFVDDFESRKQRLGHMDLVKVY
jgi:hypothetical protein